MSIYSDGREITQYIPKDQEKKPFFFKYQRKLVKVKQNHAVQNQKKTQLALFWFCV